MLQRYEFRAMGCDMLVLVDSESASPRFASVPAWFEEWEQVFSRFRYDSELMRLNQIHERPVPVSQTLWEVFQTAQEAEQRTSGLVTPTLLDAIVEAGYDRPFDLLPHLASPALAPVQIRPRSLKEIAVDTSAQTITLPPGMGLDFGGIAKGWAAHQTMNRLQSDGPTLIDAGGDIAVSGPRADGRPWQIGVADPFEQRQEIETLFVDGGGVATSGKDRRRWTRNGMLQHHLIDPLSGQPAKTDLLTVTVVGPQVMQAETAAKAAFLLGSRAGLDWIEARPELAALLILDNGQMIYSRNMEKFLSEERS